MLSINKAANNYFLYKDEVASCHTLSVSEDILSGKHCTLCTNRILIHIRQSLVSQFDSGFRDQFVVRWLFLSFPN